MGYHIILENSGGELDGRFAANEEDIAGAIVNLAQNAIFSDGDVIRVVKAKPLNFGLFGDRSQMDFADRQDLKR